VVALGFNVLYSDLDVMWLRDPLPYMGQFPEADLLISLDTVGARARLWRVGTAVVSPGTACWGAAAAP
jgi:hypothetical protein